MCVWRPESRAQRGVLTPAPRRVLWEDANATRNVWGPSTLCWPGLHILAVTPTSTGHDKTPAFPAGWQLDRTKEGGERGRGLTEISKNILWAHISVENQHRCQPFFFLFFFLTPRPNVRLVCFCFLLPPPPPITPLHKYCSNPSFW